MVCGMPGDEVDLICVECPTCGGEGPPRGPFYVHSLQCCLQCNGSGWILVEGTPIDLADLERMAPWADAVSGRPLEAGELGV